MKKRTQESKKKSKIIFLIIILSAIISITGTYAWFSSQRDVEIVGFKINVEIAENLEISLDGETWTHTITVENMRQFYGTYKDQDENTIAHQAKKDQHRNYVPTELLPVSTIGTLEDGNLVFVGGEIKDNKLSNIAKCSEEDIVVGAPILTKEGKNANHPYLVFDMYLRNLSRLKEEGERDLLQLNTGSVATAQKLNTGLEYSVRVGLVQYGETVSSAALGTDARAIGVNGEEAVAIWEPNYRLHTEAAVNNDSRLTALVEQIDTYAVKDKISVNVNGEMVQQVPTQIEDITKSDNPALYPVHTNKVEQEETVVTDEDEIATQNLGTKTITTLKQIDGVTDMSLEPNTITKVRCYIWLEGQDPDCTNIASTGDELRVTLRLTKPKTNGTGTGTSYAD